MTLVMGSDGGLARSWHWMENLKLAVAASGQYLAKSYPAIDAADPAGANSPL